MDKTLTITEQELELIASIQRKVVTKSLVHLQTLDSYVHSKDRTRIVNLIEGIKHGNFALCELVSFMQTQLDGQSRSSRETNLLVDEISCKLDSLMELETQKD